jgi:hypothetical protein
MVRVPALKAAVDLLHFPSQAARLRGAPLPAGVPLLLRIASGDAEAIKEASEGEDRSPETIREAAAFFLEQILLKGESNSYRVLGATPAASQDELRRNMSLLLQWLHPDLDQHDARSVFASKVTRAWDAIKTPDRRAAYDRTQRLNVAERSERATQTKRPVIRRRSLPAGSRLPNLLWRTLGSLFAILNSVFGRFEHWK